jgi:hypothetical protein
VKDAIAKSSANSSSGDKIKKTEMGRVCSTYEGEERCTQSFSWET